MIKAEDPDFENKGLSISLTVVPMEVGTMRMFINIAPLSMANLMDECPKTGMNSLAMPTCWGRILTSHILEERFND